MLKFIKLVVLFSLPIIVAMVSFELYLRKIPNDYAYKKKYLDAQSNHIEVLILGSSHTYYGINPYYSKHTVFNAAYVSQTLNFDYAILEKYKNSWKSLKYIIVPVDYFSLYETLETGIEHWRVKNYNIYYDIAINKNYWNNFELFNGNFSGNIFRLKSHLLNPNLDINCNKWGFGTNHNSKNGKNLIETGKTNANTHTYDLASNGFLSKNIQTLHSIIEFSEINNVKIIFITSPAYYTYRKNLKAQQLYHTINTIKQLSSKNVHTFYYNLLADSTFLASDYYDANHLNEFGAKKLTIKIDSIINSIETIKLLH
jgi:hypothetical protein